MLLPKFVVLKSINNDKYLRYRYEDGVTKEFLQCSGDEEWSPYTKFEVVKATCDDRYIHLKCCYNNKYLTICNEDDMWMVARADQPDEDRNKPTCTMFKPQFDGNDQRTVRFKHVKLYYYVCRGYGGDFTNCVYLADDVTTSGFTYVDWETIVPPEPKDYNIEIGEWGGWEGDDWSFEVDGGITKMIIQSKDVVEAVSFVGQTADGSQTIESRRFGGDQGDKSKPEEIVLDWPNEYLTLIRGTHGTSSSCDSHVITSLEFITNQGKKIGPFGKKSGTAFALKMKRGAIVGFHGRSSDFIDAIGVFTRHVDPHKAH